MRQAECQLLGAVAGQAIQHRFTGCVAHQAKIAPSAAEVAAQQQPKQKMLLHARMAQAAVAVAAGDQRWQRQIGRTCKPDMNLASLQARHRSQRKLARVHQAQPNARMPATPKAPAPRARTQSAGPTPPRARTGNGE